MNWYGNRASGFWDPEKATALTRAFDEATHRADALGMNIDAVGCPVSDIIASYIVRGAARGSYDAHALAEGAISYLRGKSARDN